MFEDLQELSDFAFDLDQVKPWPSPVVGDQGACAVPYVLPALALLAGAAVLSMALVIIGWQKVLQGTGWHGR
jgi:hypothetical protein